MRVTLKTAMAALIVLAALSALAATLWRSEPCGVCRDAAADGTVNLVGTYEAGALRLNNGVEVRLLGAREPRIAYPLFVRGRLERPLLSRVAERLGARPTHRVQVESQHGW